MTNKELKSQYQKELNITKRRCHCFSWYFETVTLNVLKGQVNFSTFYQFSSDILYILMSKR